MTEEEVSASICEVVAVVVEHVVGFHAPLLLVFPEEFHE
jgi:hypothetical protein